MREKLIELIQASVGGCTRHWAEVIADYQLENGVVVLPCRVGDILFCLYQEAKKNTNVIELEIDTFEIHKDYIVINGYIGEHCYRYLTDEIGKTVFLTREDAERALGEKEEKNG